MNQISLNTIKTAFYTIVFGLMTASLIPANAFPYSQPQSLTSSLMDVAPSPTHRPIPEPIIGAAPITVVNAKKVQPLAYLTT